MTPTEIAATENDARVIRNKAKIRATVHNAREVLAILDSYGSIRAYFASFPDAHAASADMRRRFKFLGDTGVWRLLISATRDTGGDLAVPGELQGRHAHTMVTDISGVLTYTLLGVSPPADAPCGAAGNVIAWTKLWRLDRHGGGPARYDLESATRRICGPRPRK
jgi:hypothetical protein